MNLNEVDFPVYRKLNNSRSFYKIIDLENFIELQKMGSKVFVHEVKAIQYPEKLRIRDMIECQEPFEESTETEFILQNEKN